MSTRTATWLAWSLWAASVVLSGFAIFFAVLNQAGSVLENVLTGIGLALPFPTVGGLIISRRPSNAIGWIFCVVGLLQGLNIFSFEYGTYALRTEPGSLPGGAEMTWVAAWTWILSLALLLTFLLLLFPDGRLPSPRWRWAAWLAAAGLTLTVTSVAAGTWPSRGVELLISWEPGDESLWFLVILGFTVIGVAAVASVISLMARYRRSSGIERQQIKWFTFAGGVALVAVSTAFTPWGHEIVLGLGVITIPIATGIAILRYRLYDIDIIIRRTLIYGVLTGTLALMYFGSVVLLQQVFRTLTGQQQSEGVTVISTLAIAALFVPLRRRVQDGIDRRFYRKKYDAAKTLAAFSATVRDETDLDKLTEQLVAVVQETMQPAHVSLWLKPMGTRQRIQDKAN